MRKVTVSLIAEVCARLLNRESQSSIQKRTGMGTTTIGKAIAVMRAQGILVETAAATRLDPERETLLHEAFRTSTRSNREIVAATGINLTAINKSRQRFNAALVQAGGELPQCECGQYLHHARMCWARQRDNLAERGIRSFVTLDPTELEQVRRYLLAGATKRAIGERFNLSKDAVARILRSLTAEDRRAREDNFLVAAARRRAAVLARAIVRPRAINPTADPLYAEIARSVPHGIDPALRDDMISQAYLEVLEGRLDRTRLREGVRKVRGRVFSAFANPWGNRSLDAPLREGGTGTAADLIADDRALEAFEALA